MENLIEGCMIGKPAAALPRDTAFSADRRGDETQTTAMPSLVRPDYGCDCMDPSGPKPRVGASLGRFAFVRGRR